MIPALERAIQAVTNILCLIGMGMLVALMTIGTLDVIGRYFFNHPIKGAYEISEILLAGAVFFGLAYTAAVEGHVVVDTFVIRFQPRLRALAGLLTTLLSLVIFALIAWQGTLKALGSWRSHRLIDTIFVPIAPFQLFVTIGALAMCLQLIIQLLRFYKAAREG